MVYVWVSHISSPSRSEHSLRHGHGERASRRTAIFWREGFSKLSKPKTSDAQTDTQIHAQADTLDLPNRPAVRNLTPRLGLPFNNNVHTVHEHVLHMFSMCMCMCMCKSTWYRQSRHCCEALDVAFPTPPSAQNMVREVLHRDDTSSLQQCIAWCFWTLYYAAP